MAVVKRKELNDMKARVKSTGEIWKDVVGYEELYMVSNTGRIKSKDRMVWNGNCYYFQKGRVLKYSICKNGYKYVSLSDNGKSITKSVHRLVASAFISNEKNLPCVNHKDENKLNDNVENLEWCTVEYNNRYGTKIDRISDTQIKNSELKKGVLALLGDGGTEEFASIRDAERKTGINSSHISECCRGIRKSAGKVKWVFADELIKQLKKK